VTEDQLERLAALVKISSAHKALQEVLTLADNNAKIPSNHFWQTLRDEVAHDLNSLDYLVETVKEKLLED
jgi:hypothetical protein